MIPYPQIDPVALSMGPLSIHWYGLMYVVGLAAAWSVGIILGGRLGYVLFYGLDQLAADPLWLFRLWEGGMSFHGGLAGVLVAAWWFARRHRLAFLQLTDFIAPLVPIGLGAGRLGNFINHELPGRVSDVPWAMVFPSMMGLGSQPRHPSALYEFALEGVVLFVVLWWVSARPRRRGTVSGLFLVLYGVFRFAVEFARLPDPQLGFIAFDWLTMGQLLSLPMMVAGLLLLIAPQRRGPIDAVASTGRPST